MLSVAITYFNSCLIDGELYIITVYKTFSVSILDEYPLPDGWKQTWTALYHFCEWRGSYSNNQMSTPLTEYYIQMELQPAFLQMLPNHKVSRSQALIKAEGKNMHIINVYHYMK